MQEINEEIENNDLDEHVENIKQKSTRKTKNKKRIIYSIFILFNVIALLVVLLLENKSGDMAAGREVMQLLGKNWYFTVLVFAIFILQIGADTIAFYFLTKQVGVKNNFMLSLRVGVLGRYYDKLTPWSTGGQPMQMAYLANQGLDTATACAIPLAKSIIKVFVVGITVIGILSFSRISVNIYITIAAYLSVGGGLLVPVFMILLMRHPQWGQSFAKWVIKMLYKMKIVKNYDAQVAKFTIMVDNFLKGMGYLSTHRKMVFVVGLMTLVELFIINATPFFIMKAFGIYNVNYWFIFVLCLYVSYASYFAPSPGAAGVAELSFYTIFATVITGNYLFWAILLWRIIIYYLPILAGLILQISEGARAIIGKRKGHTK